MKSYEQLVKKALSAMKNAYCPYSGFSVGAALLCRSGKTYLGCNIENAAYSPSVCAERVAFFKAVSEGEREFEAIAIVGGKSGDAKENCPPCGVCRQVMREFCGDDFKILLGKKDGPYETFTLSELLPESFSPKQLENGGEAKS